MMGLSSFSDKPWIHRNNTETQVREQDKWTTPSLSSWKKQFCPGDERTYKSQWPKLLISLKGAVVEMPTGTRSENAVRTASSASLGKLSTVIILAQFIKHWKRTVAALCPLISLIWSSRSVLDTGRGKAARGWAGYVWSAVLRPPWCLDSSSLLVFP